MFSAAIILFLLVIGMDGIFEDLQFYYRGVDQTGFQIITGCVIAVFLLIGISLHFAVLVKEKRKRTSASSGRLRSFCLLRPTLASVPWETAGMQI